MAVARRRRSGRCSLVGVGPAGVVVSGLTACLFETFRFQPGGMGDRLALPTWLLRCSGRR